MVDSSLIAANMVADIKYRPKFHMNMLAEYLSSISIRIHFQIPLLVHFMGQTKTRKKQTITSDNTINPTFKTHIVPCVRIKQT